MSERKLFGTDGIRGRANVDPMTRLSQGAQLPPAEVNSAGPPLRFWGPSPKTQALS
jgi:hypothetical protein